jgi:hypothetical protein
MFFYFLVRFIEKLLKKVVFYLKMLKILTKKFLNIYVTIL